MKHFVRKVPEFEGGALSCDFPDDVNVKSILENGWLLADSKEDKKTQLDKENKEEKEDKNTKKTETVKTEKVETLKTNNFGNKGKKKSSEPLF